jgi:hypothetical protein
MWSIAVPRDDVEALARMVTDVSAARAEFLVL